MISRTYTPALPHGSVFSDGSCIVDIETEGRFWRTSKLLRAYAIVCGDPCTEYEWIAEKEADEYDILSELSKILKRADHLMTFNGNSFDLPHLRKKYQAYRASDPTGGRKSLDLMHELMPYRFLFDLESYHLKDYLSLFGDRYEVRNEAEGALLASCLLDLAGLFDAPAGELHAVLGSSLLGVTDPGSSGDGSAAAVEQRTVGAGSDPAVDHENGGSECVLTVEWTRDASVPIDIEISDEVFRLTAREKSVKLSVANDGVSLRRYYKDYENYDFLLAEGYAAHKSLTAYVAADRKVKAVRENCYSLIPISSVYPGREVRLSKYVQSVLSYLRRDIPASSL